MLFQKFSQIIFQNAALYIIIVRDRHLIKTFFRARKQKAMGQRSLQYRETKFWNELPNSVKSANHFKAFVKLLTCHLIASY